MTPTYKQLELDLWGDLKTALTDPEATEMELLWHSLESAIAQARPVTGFALSDSNEQLSVAGDAISQIVQVYVKRANSILDSLEVTDSSDGPVLDEDFLSGLMRSSIRIDLSDLIEEFAFDDVESSPISTGSVVSILDRKEARALARKARAAMKTALKELAEKENIPKWQQAIALWLQQHQGEKVSLWKLQQALAMPLVEVWLGLLHSPTPYQWDRQGEFYQEVRDFWISN
ncbi:hypothetical protein [Chlorogloea sp. CCALA 695]|uniref:hypothetical protein n=1 Tax=Chlorogloea sp. CCALA 695 TaxID=2107693 RepID=UPI000D05EB01|nr:hypothetical protein [Chlorogloea sp. CCALA 695]PSB26054.1 hypothetical protein C7B70_24410 [Chlorogloea sp. CCALA 695]